MKLRISVVSCVALCAAYFTPVATAHAQQDSALLDALVKKGVLSNKERKEIEADEQKDSSMTAANKINLGSSIKSIQFYGDARLRFEMRDGTVSKGDINSGGTVFGHDDSQTRNRWRYRLRFGVKGDLYDNFFYGFRLATNPTYDRSGNVSFGDSDSAGPFGKGKSLLAVDQIFLGWRPTDYLTLTGGQMPNPFYTTGLIWDDNINPAGAAEHFDKTFDDVEIFATAGQFVYGESADNAAFTSGGSNFSDVFLFAEQVGFKYKFDKDTAFKMGAGFYTYSGTQNGDAGGTVAGLYSSAPLNFSAPNASPSSFTGPFVGAGPAPATNNTGINSLAVLEVPMEVDFKAWDVPMRFFSNFAYNFDADQRSNAARVAVNSLAANNFVGSKFVGNTGVTAFNTGGAGGMTPGDVANNTAMLSSPNFKGILSSGQGLLDQMAYQVGFEAGQLKKKGDWQTRLYWQSTGYYAVDANLIDADIFNAATNLQGIVVQASYNWTDGLSSTLRYANGTRVNGQLATPNVNQDLQINPIHDYNLFQADLMWKF